MRILLVEPVAHMPGYFAEYVRGLSKALAESGADISLVTFDGLAGDGQTGINVRHTSFVESAGRTGRLCRSLPGLIPLKSIRGVFSEILSTTCGLGLALRMAKKEPFDIIHVPAIPLPEYFYPTFALLLNKRNIVFGLWIHSREEDIKGWGTRFKQAISHRQLTRCLRLMVSVVLAGKPGMLVTNHLHRWAMKRNHLSFISDSPSIIETYASAPFRDRLRLIPLAVDTPWATPVPGTTARQRLNLPQDKFVLLHFGTNHAYKDFPTIFKAVEDLPLDYRLVFAGKVLPQYRENDPAHLARRHGLESRTTIVDQYIPDEEVLHYFCAADAIVLGHLKGFRSVSGVLYVAVQYGVPIIAADAGDDGNVVREFGLGITYEAENPGSLRKAILGYARLAPGDKQAITDNLSQFAERYSWRRVAEEHVRVYEATIEGGQV